MTTYSVLGSDERVAVLANWPARMSDQAVKVTTVTGRETASDLAYAMTTVSEAAWYASAWLDTWPAIRTYLVALADWARQPTLPAQHPTLDLDGRRHARVASTSDSIEAFDQHLPRTMTDLSTTQRLAVADDITAEVSAIDEALAVYPTGDEPADRSRAWQFGEVTREMHYGIESYLPEGAASWALTHFDAVIAPEMWAARGHLLRIEQLAAACLASGGRSGPLAEPAEMNAHCVWGHGADTRNVHVWSQRRDKSYWHYLPRQPMVVTEQLGHGEERVLGQVDPYDTDGFVRLLGDWVSAVPFHG